MRIDELVSEVGRIAECKLLPPVGIPKVDPPNEIPADLLRFYELCGGAELFLSADFGFRVVAPTELLPANPILLGDYYLKHKVEIDADISAAWYLICRGGGPEENVVINLDPKRPGRCYDAFHEIYATGDSRIVAQSFSELVASLLAAKGKTLFWQMPGFRELGFAYD